MFKQNNIYRDKTNPKVIVVSHNCFSKTGSNGRTLGNFLINWPKESIAQFYINSEIPDSEVCDNYFHVTDVEALKAFYKGEKVGSRMQKEIEIDSSNDTTLNNLYKKHKTRTSFNYIARNLIWDSNRWVSEGFENWVDDFNPDVVLLQLGDYAFMIRIALKVAKRKNIPLIIYSSEDYYFKDRKSFSPLYNYYRYDYKKQVRELMNYSSFSIYNSEMLQQTYIDEFEHNSTVIMTSTDIGNNQAKVVKSNFKISYLGNLGVGRHEPLIEIANALQKISSNLYLDIYGKSPSEDVEMALKACKGIKLKGFVSYEEVVDIMKSSDLLVHAENFSEFYKWDLKHAFSTKIADSLASGTCLFMYAPENLACTKYLLENNAACVVTEKEKLLASLGKIINQKLLRQEYIENALEIVGENHNAELNAEKFRNVILSVLKR